MDSSFFAYLQQLELLSFFSGYAIIYSITLFLADSQKLNGNFINRVVRLLPFSYALVGTLFLGYLLKKLYPEYSIEHIKHIMPQSLLTAWALLSLLFWIPAISKKKALSLIHSLVFFFFVIRDLFLQLTSSSTDSNIVKNDMKVYGASIVLNLATMAFVALISFSFSYYQRRSKA